MYEITLCLPSHQTVPPSGSHPIPPIPDRKASATLESSFPGPSVPMICEQSPTLPLPDYGHGSGPPPPGALLSSMLPPYNQNPCSSLLQTHLRIPSTFTLQALHSVTVLAHLPALMLHPPHVEMHRASAWNCHFMSLGLCSYFPSASPTAFPPYLLLTHPQG